MRQSLRGQTKTDGVVHDAAAADTRALQHHEARAKLTEELNARVRLLQRRIFVQARRPLDLIGVDRALGNVGPGFQQQDRFAFGREALRQQGSGGSRTRDHIVKGHVRRLRHHRQIRPVQRSMCRPDIADQIVGLWVGIVREHNQRMNELEHVAYGRALRLAQLRVDDDSQ